MGFPKFNTGSLFHIKIFLPFDHMRKVLPGIAVIPAAIIVPVLVMLPPVSVQAGIQTRIGGYNLGDFIRVRHVIISLSLVEIIHPCLVYRFLG